MSTVGDSPLVSILMVTHRRHDAFGNSFESVRAATRGLPVEFVVVVNGVPIQPEHRAAQACGATLLLAPVNLGFAGGLQAARAVARGRHLAIVQDDVEVGAGWLEPLVETLDADPSVGAVSSRVEFADGALQHEGWILWGDATISVCGSQERLGPRRAVDASGSASLLVRARAWDEVGGPDRELFPLGWVDLDLCLRLTRAGWTVMVEPQSVVRHRTHSRTKTRFRHYLDVRNGGRVIPRYADVLGDRPLHHDAPEALALQLLRCADEAERRRSTSRPDPTWVRSNSTPMQTLVRDARRQARSVRVGYLAWRMRGMARRLRERWGHGAGIDGATGARAPASSTEAVSAGCLVVGCGKPWEQRLTGRVLRDLALLRGLRRAGPVDYWCLEDADDAGGPRPGPGLEAAPPDGVVTEIPYRTGRSGRASRLRWFMSGPRPTTPWELSRLALTPSGPTIGDLTARATSYESVWVLDDHAAQLLRPLIDAGVTPVVVDLADLIDQQYRQRLERFDARPGPGRLRARHRAFLQRSAGAWERWHREIVETATCTLVTNADDAARLPDGRVTIVPNGCVIPRGVVQRERTAGLARVLFQGALFYEPNRDAVITLVTEIAPRLEALIGATFEVRLVGEARDSLAWLAEMPRVTMTGYVEDIEDELRGATLVAVPLEVASGTRLKILEAWAHRIPVVSTTLGCAGLGAQDGVHLLIADAPDAFAAACARLVVDPDLAERLAANAHALAVERYDWSIIEGQVADLRRRVSGAASPSPAI